MSLLANNNFFPTNCRFVFFICPMGTIERYSFIRTYWLYNTTVMFDFKINPIVQVINVVNYKCRVGFFIISQLPRYTLKMKIYKQALL